MARKSQGITCLSLPSAGMTDTHYSSCFFTARFEGPLYITYKVINLALHCNLYLDASIAFSSEPRREGKINSHGQLPFVCFNFVLVYLDSTC